MSLQLPQTTRLNYSKPTNLLGGTFAGNLEQQHQ